MTVFDAYAAYYDLLYTQKDYASEAAAIKSLISQFAPGARSLLDLGCGTGRHALELARSGFDVVGVDRAPAMIQGALERARADEQLSDKVTFVCGDLGKVRLDNRFDVVTALFHVMSYQTADTDLIAALVTAREHLSHGGLFIFDGWYGPAVLAQRPSIRVKRMSGDSVSVVRLAEPELIPEENCVIVDYTIFVSNREGAVTDVVRESHKMRYFFNREIDQVVNQVGLRLLSAPRSKPASLDSPSDYNATWVVGLCPR